MKLFLVLASLFLLIPVKPTSAESRTLWQIGKYDQSIWEYSARASDHVVFDVGKSNWHTDWPGTESQNAQYEIRFPVAQSPRGVFTLTISTLISYPRVPAIQIEINGHRGVYYLHPKTLYLGDQRFRRAYILSIEMPAAYVRQGDNSLLLSVVPSRTDKTHTGPVYERIAYDYISLSNNPAAKFNRDAIQADVAPTIFYLQSGGHLVEIVDAVVRFNKAHPAGNATLTLAGEHNSVPLQLAQDFGEESLEFSIPAWQGTTAGHLALTDGVHKNFPLSLTAAKRWTVFVVPHTHVDIGYTDYQGKVAENQAHALEEAASMIKQHPDFRFSTDGSWDVQQFLETRSGTMRSDAVDLMREGKIGVPAQYFNLLTGYASLETLYRSLYYSRSLARTYKIPFNYANITDVPSYTGSYPSVLASAGIKYWAAAVNGDRAPLLVGEQWNEKSPFWWEGPDGQKVLFWCSRGYAQIGSVFSNDPTMDSIREGLPMFMEQYESPDYKPDAALMYGAQAENTDLRPQLATFAGEWNQQYAYPRLQYATFYDFFKYIDVHFGPELATYKGDMGAYWEDGIASDAFYAAEDRSNQGRALSANVLSAVAHVIDPNVHAPQGELNAAWNNILLFAEHTWGADVSIGHPQSEEAVSQLAVKDNYVTQARFELNDITQRSLSQIVRNIHVPAGTLVIFNTLNWTRDALVETDLRNVGTGARLIDLSNGQTVPFETVSDDHGFEHIRFLARDLPPVGYKCYELKRSTNQTTPSSEANPGKTIENQYYRVTVDPETGSVRSIYDKQLGRELVDQKSPYRFGEYLYVTGGDPNRDDRTQMIHPFAALPVPQLTIHPATAGAYLGTTKLPWGYSIKLSSSDVNTPQIQLEILLFNNEKKIEFHYAVQKNYTTDKEAIYFAFPAAVETPHFAYASQDGWVDPSHDMLRGGDVEWFSVQKWMAVSDADLSIGIVPLDAPLATFGDINRGHWPIQFKPASSTIFSYAMNNYWHTNYRAGQGGTFNFRFAITSAPRFDPPALSRFGAEAMRQPALDWVINQDKVNNPDEPLPASGASFLTGDSGNIRLVTWKEAEDHRGTILRLQEIAGQSSTVTLHFAHMIVSRAALCNSVEDDLQPLPVTNNELRLTFRPNGVMTVRLIP